MIEWIITSCVLIVIVLLLRLALKGRISLGLQYALWVLVLVRLLIPVNFFSSPMSVMNAVPEPEPAVELPQEITPTEYIDLELPEPELPQIDYSAPVVEQTPVTPTVTVVPDRSPTPTVEDRPTLSLKQILLSIWVLGMAVCCAVIAAANIRFTLRLKRSRQKVEADCSLPVYSTRIIDTPCLFGIFRPVIYLTAEELEEEERLHVLTHELTHYRHLDHIWALLRSLCLVLHWYNPLVWVAAILSRRDAELACDEATIRRLGEDSRAEYGKTLIRMTCAKQELGSILTTATTMTGSKKTIAQRIRLIAKHPKTAALAIICLVLAAAIAVGCTFTGANEPANEENTTPVVETATVTDKPAAEVLTTSYKLEDLRAVIGDRESSKGTIFAETPTSDIRLDVIQQSFPIECLKSRYIVYAVTEGGYFYILPKMDKASYDVGEQVVLADTQVECAFYIPKVCSSSDYENIEVGKSTQQDVLDMDFNIVTITGDSWGMASYSVLSDGRPIVIEYNSHDFSDTAIISNIQIGDIGDEVYNGDDTIWWTIILQEDWPTGTNIKAVTVTDKRAAEVLTEHYELSKLREFFGEYETYYTSGIEADPITLSQVYDKFPDFCLKKDYAVIPVLDGGYYYVFWSEKGSSEVGDEIDLTNATVEKAIYVPRICVASDFNGIVVGESTADDIKAIDPAVILDYGLDSFGGAYSRGHEYYCFILLKDETGLFVGFDYSDSSEETLIVKEMEAVTELHGPGWWFDISEEDWPRDAGVNSLPSDTEITLAEYLTQTGLDINAPYLHFNVNFNGKRYYFSSHNYLFMYDWYVLIHSSFKPKEQSDFDDSLDYICIIVEAAYGTDGAIYVNEADQLLIGNNNYYEVPGLYGEIEHRISDHTEKSDRYFELDETGPTTTYTVYGFDKVDENNRRPYYLYLTDDNFVYVWSQYGTGTIARMSKFYDPATGRVSPAYRAPTDYYQNMVVCYYDPEDLRSYGDITIVDMFSGQVLYKVDEKDLPADRNLALAADTVYFNYDGSQIILDYHTDGFVRKWHTINIPPEVRLNRTVTTYKTTDQLPRYKSGTLTQKPWEDPEEKPASNIPVPDQQAATEIAEAVINTHFTGYKTTAVGFHPTVKVWVVSLSNGSKDLMIAISWQDADILGVWESDAPYEAGTAPWVKAKNILTAPYIADKETAGLIGEAIRAGISRQAGLHYPHACVKDVYYEETAGYWLIHLYQHAQYPVDAGTVITIDKKDGHIVKMWHYSY